MSEPKTLNEILHILDEKKIEYSKVLKWSEVRNILVELSNYVIFKSIRLGFKGDGINGVTTIDSVSTFENFFPKPETENPWMFILDINVKD